jgi:hypothetical protein
VPTFSRWGWLGRYMSKIARTRLFFEPMRLWERTSSLVLPPRSLSRPARFLFSALCHLWTSACRRWSMTLAEERDSSSVNFLRIGLKYVPTFSRWGWLGRYTELESRSSAKVTLKAREVLIQCAMPSLDERLSQMGWLGRYMSKIARTRLFFEPMRLWERTVWTMPVMFLAILDMYRPNQPHLENVGTYFKPILKKLTELESRNAGNVVLVLLTELENDILVAEVMGGKQLLNIVVHQPHLENVGTYFKPILKKLTELESRSSAKVTLKAFKTSKEGSRCSHPVSP